MGFDLSLMLRQADEYLRRQFKSKAVRQAEKRRTGRQSREAGRRLKRASRLGGFETHRRFLESRYTDQKLPSSRVE